MKQLLARTGSADFTIIGEAVMARAEKFNAGQEVCLQIPSAASAASKNLQVLVQDQATPAIADSSAD